VHVADQQIDVFLPEAFLDRFRPFGADDLGKAAVTQDAVNHYPEILVRIVQHHVNIFYVLHFDTTIITIVKWSIG
jgi:hypothetical protein